MTDFGVLNQQLDDPAFPAITYRRGAAGLPVPVIRGSGVRVQTIVIAHQRWEMTPVKIAEEYGLTQRQIDEALAFFAAYHAEIETQMDREARQAEESHA